MSGPNLDIVLVEDDASLRHALQRMLQAAGYLVRPYGSAEALLEVGIDQTKQCDCLVLDICLPGMSGIDLSRTLLATKPCPPFILITGIDTPGLRDLASRTGAHGYLLKPFTGTELLEAIKRAMAG
ncbi:MAG: response regulator [Onishia taeanensis]|uniref:response regulator transcription factor n=1 Tax=Onishia taeanensis TaxID=284577 RepID=UPI003C7CB03B